jgi:predicted small metal-binding protein
MRKILECGAIVPGCNFVARADSDEELLRKAADHARSAHGVDHMSGPLKAKVKAAIREEAEA